MFCVFILGRLGKENNFVANRNLLYFFIVTRQINPDYL